MKLLRELVEKVEYVTEEVNGEKKFYLQGPFLQAELVNRNHRRYPVHVLAQETARYIKENIDRKTAWGELNHPTGPNINLDRVCLRTVALKQEGNNFVGRALVTPTPMGNIVRGLVESGGTLGVSSRALGSLKPVEGEDGVNEVQDDLRLLAIDCVGDPSAPDAWVAGILEDIEYFYKGNSGEIAEVAKHQLEKLSSNELRDEAKILRMFEEYINQVAKTI